MPAHHGWNDFWHFFNPLEHFFFLSIGALAILFHRYWQKLREDRAAGWPSASGVVQSATVKARNGYWVEISYCYYAMLQYRYGKCVRHFRKKDAAEEFAAALRGYGLQVRYREDDPDVSVVMQRDLELAGALHTR
jgi:hypothetical protein